jgi:hypothetical protein
MTHTTSNRYLILLAAVIFGTLLLNCIAVVVVDPFKIFGAFEVNRRNFEPNTRYLKVEYLRRHPEFDGFILGSSRANGYSVEVANRLAGGQHYNFTVAGDTMLGMLRKVEWLMATRTVRHLMVTFSFDDFILSTESMQTLMKIEHPQVSGESALLFGARYLLAPNAHPLNMAKALYGNFLKTDDWYQFDVTTGHYDFPLFRRQMAEGPERYIRERFSTPAMTDHRLHHDSLAALTELVRLARTAGIRLTIIVNPDNSRTFLSFRPDAYRAWLTEVIDAVGEVWDFSGLTLLTQDDAGFFEQRHFQPAVGEQVLEAIFAARRDDLGVLVNKQTLPGRLNALRRQWMAQGGKIAELANNED